MQNLIIEGFDIDHYLKVCNERSKIAIAVDRGCMELMRAASQNVELAPYFLEEMKRYIKNKEVDNIQEIIVYDKILGEADETKVNEYLDRKYDFLEEEIIKEYEAFDLEGRTVYKVKKTNKTRTISKFTYLPLWLNKFSWLQKVDIVQRKYIVQKECFDEYNVEFRLSKPYEEWRNETIL